MCGIAGYVGEVHPLAATALGSMTLALAHRGPDAQGQHVERFGAGRYEVGLGHRRLAIVDVQGGDQPIANENGRVQIIFNGEIYNHRTLRRELQARGHRFATATDTETIVHAYEEYGEACVQHLRGMFAFALWDADRESLLLARDRYGEKPLYHVEIDGRLVFASELRALQSWPGFETRLNVELLPQYLQYRYVPGPETWIGGVRKLPPGCLLRWSTSGSPVLRYFQAPDAHAPVARRPAADMARAVADKLDETVALMMDSEVPYGAFLSGGLDSSAIVALMAKHHRGPVRTFSIGFAEPGFSELSYAATVARRFGTEHRELMVDGADIARALPSACRYRDAPLAEPADVPMYLLACEARRTVKMVLTGEGSDEAFGGYPKHVAELLGSPYRALPRALRRGLVEPLLHAWPRGPRRLRTALEALGVDSFEERMPRWFGALSSADILRLCGRRPPPLANGSRYPFESDPATSALRRMLYFDQTSWLPDNLLERGDRMTMAASLEARMPFMDHELIDLVSSFPDQLRVRGVGTKRVLRTALAGIVPDEIIARRKVGFSMPIERWLRTGLREMLGDLLLGPSSQLAGLMDATLVQRYVEEHWQGRRNHDKLLWTLLNLELWARSILGTGHPRAATDQRAAPVIISL